MATSAIEKNDAAELAETNNTRNVWYYRPNVDIIERSDELVVLADMPGVKAGDVDINLENGLLTIHGRVADREREDGTRTLREYGVGDFYRTFQVSDKVDAERITADCSDGVLTLHLPKTEAVKPRKIAVKTG